MNIFTMLWRSREAKKPTLDAAETALLKSLETEPAKWSIRKIKIGQYKLDHRESGVWIVAAAEPGAFDSTRVESVFAGHYFSRGFTLAVLKLSEAKVEESERKANEAASKSAIETILRSFSDS